MKVVQFVEGHNFHVDWHFKFWVEKDEKRGQLSASLVHRNRVTFKVWLRFVHNPLRKHYRAFVEVVEGSEIYNFAISPSRHYNSNFGRNCAQSCLVEIVSATLQPHRDVAPARRWARPHRAVPPACAPRRAALPEAAPLGCGSPETVTHTKAPCESALSRSASRCARTQGLAAPARAAPPSYVLLPAVAPPLSLLALRRKTSPIKGPSPLPSRTTACPRAARSATVRHGRRH
jgi:hypothetical protein